MIAGGYYEDPDDWHLYNSDEILEYDPVEDSFRTVGKMIGGRSYHALSVVKVQDYAPWCQ